jgi:hypothetical protein
MNTTTPIKKDQKQFEFTLYLNDNIIVQRYFNVIGFNNNAFRSLDFKEALDINSEIIKFHLKNKTLDYMMENSRQYYENPSYDQNKNNDKIKMVVKMNDRVIGSREWDATIYPVKIRYTVDIRQYIYDIITRIQKCLSEKTDRLETTYLEHNLN